MLFLKNSKGGGGAGRDLEKAGCVCQQQTGRCLCTIYCTDCFLFKSPFLFYPCSPFFITVEFESLCSMATLKSQSSHGTGLVSKQLNLLMANPQLLLLEIPPDRDVGNECRSSLGELTSDVISSCPLLCSFYFIIF